ncbi:hypothetical protein HPP92_011020 [Vanilla planifolia]|uniref:Uncharacterized protein n=1 Tax=Vanilla planifolia TaxID=51239 RepID=A0A835R6B1_VANPL|nr:hypothetical protein HPP92_011020 [Vanilla planifolia]
MLPADELFSDGKLVPLHLSIMRPVVDSLSEITSPEPIHPRRMTKISTSDVCAFSPKAPRCSSRWKELLGWKKAQNRKLEDAKTDTAHSKGSSTKTLKHLFHKNLRSSSTSDSSLSLPLLRDVDCELVSISARASLSSSSSSSADHDDLPRLSLDLERISPLPTSAWRNPARARLLNARSPPTRRPPSDLASGGSMAVRFGRIPMRQVPESIPESYMAVRVGRSPMRRGTTDPCEFPPPRGSSVDSPRLNASGKVIFQGLERSSSSPSTFNGGPRPRSRGTERSYSSNVPVITPVLNVPVCSLRGSAKSASVFGLSQLFSPQKKEKESSSAAKNGISNLTGVKRVKSTFNAD